MKLCVTSLCEGPFDKPIECKTCNSTGAITSTGTHNWRGISDTIAATGTTEQPNVNASCPWGTIQDSNWYDVWICWSPAVHHVIFKCTKCSKQSSTREVCHNHISNINGVQPKYPWDTSTCVVSRICDTCKGKKLCSHGSDKTHYTCEHNDICDFTMHVIN